MKRNTIAVFLLSAAVGVATAVSLYETHYFGSNEPKFAFISEEKASPVLNVSFNYTNVGEYYSNGSVTSEYKNFYPYSPSKTLWMLAFEIDKLSTSKQVQSEYLNCTYLSSITNNTPNIVVNETYLGFNYSYFYGIGSDFGFYTFSSVYSVNSNFVLKIQILLHQTISNSILTRLIQIQIQIMQ